MALATLGGMGAWAAPLMLKGSTALHVLTIADGGSGTAPQRAVGQRMAERHRMRAVDLVLMAGDNLYDRGDPAEAESKFQRPYRELLDAGVPFHAVLGNHDILTGHGVPQLNYAPFGMQGRWYALRRGPVEFFMIDTNRDAAWQHQMPWLKKALAASTAPWKVVIGHHPLRSSGLYGDDPRAIARLAPLFRRHGVQLSISGHEHHYERSLPINGTTYLVVGNAGASLRPVLPGPRSARAVSTYGFTELSFTDQELQIEAWNSLGERIDQARIASSGSG